MNLLTTTSLAKQFAGLTAVNDVSFELPKGQVRALIGPNGAGKTTFVGMLSGRINCTRGRVMFDNNDVTKMPTHTRMALGMAYTFQITSIYARLPVHENVALAARRVFPKQPVKIKQTIEDVLERVNLANRAKQIAGDLSYGHQRLLEIAMGLAQTPKLFILDEPTQGLAESEIEAFISLIRSLAGETTVLLIEHNMDVVMRSADYITVLNFGEILAEGTPDEIRNNQSVQSAYLGHT